MLSIAKQMQPGLFAAGREDDPESVILAIDNVSGTCDQRNM